MRRKNGLDNISKDKSVETLEMIFKFMLEGAEEVQKSFYPQLALEATLVKLTLIEPVVALDDIIARIEMLSKRIGSGNFPSHQLRDSQKAPVETREESVSYSDDSSMDVSDESLSNSEISNTNSPPSSARDFISYVKSKKPITAQGLEHADKVSIDESTIKIEFFSNSIHSDHLRRHDAQKNLRKFAKEFFNRDLAVKVDIHPSSERETDYQSLKEQNAKIKDEVYEDSIVQYALRIFGGRVVKIKTKEKE